MRTANLKNHCAGQLSLLDYLAPAEKPTTAAAKPAKDKASVNPEDLVIANERLVDYLVWRRCNGLSDADRAIVRQEGLTTLWKAAKAYDPARSPVFHPLAIKSINRDINRAIRKLAADAKELSLEMLNDSSDDDDSGHKEVAVCGDASPAELFEDSELYEYLRSFAESVPQEKIRNGTLGLLLQGLDQTPEMAAEQLGVSKLSYTSLVTLARKAIINNPKIQGYIASRTGGKMETATASILGDEYDVSFATDVDYNLLKVDYMEYLDSFAGQLGENKVGDCLLDSVAYGEEVTLVDLDSLVATKFDFDVDSVQLNSVQNIRSIFAIKRKTNKSGDVASLAKPKARRSKKAELVAMV